MTLNMDGFVKIQCIRYLYCLFLCVAYLYKSETIAFVDSIVLIDASVALGKFNEANQKMCLCNEV